MKGKLIWSVFWATLGVFVIVVSMIFIPELQRLLWLLLDGKLVVIFGFVPVLMGLGVTLLVLTVKTKVEGTLKKFLLLTGASATGLPVFGILHTVIVASGILQRVGGGTLNPDEPFFFMMATVVCPIGFLVGAVGSIVLALKSQANTNQAFGGSGL